MRTMGTDKSIDQTSLDEFDDLESNLEMDSANSKRTPKRSRRRDIEDLLEQRRLKHELEDGLDDYVF